MISLSVTLIIIVITLIITIAAFQNEGIFNKYCFYPVRVWHNKEYIRLLSGGFLHADGSHIFFNMFSLFLFGPIVEAYFDAIFEGYGRAAYFVFYILAIVVANIPDLFQNKDNSYFRAVGASGAVSAVIFASILFAPMTPMGLMFIPVRIPGFIFGLLYLGYSVYMDKRQSDNIGHLAHFSGAIFGFVFPLLFRPQLFVMFLNQILR